MDEWKIQRKCVKCNLNTEVIGYRNYYIRDMNGKTHVQALCCEKPTEENVKKAIDRFIKGKEEGRTYS